MVATDGTPGQARAPGEAGAPREVRAAGEVGGFTTVVGDRHSEVAPTLADTVPQSLGLTDQMGLWGNLGVSLLGFTGAIGVLEPAGAVRLSLAAAITVTVVGTALGALALAVSGLPGARTGAPAMVLLRGLFGARVSYLPTALNIVQLMGWGTFELVTIATAAHTVAPSMPRWLYVCIAGVLTVALTVRPLGAIRVLRRYVTVLVVVVLVYLFIELVGHPLSNHGSGSWSGFWTAMDNPVAVAVSFVPLAADYTRHSRSGRAAFGGAFVGYGITQTACYVIGLVALVTVARGPDDIYGAFIAVPLGSLAFAVLAARELDQSFANVYSTVVSVQNLRPLWDRRVLAVVIGVMTTCLALWANIGDYQSFLLLIGSVFVPLFAVLVVDFFVLSRGSWDTSTRAPARRIMMAPWALGFVTYQLINPGGISWWVSAWTWVARGIHFAPASWMSASIASFLVAGAATFVVGGAQTIARRRAPAGGRSGRPGERRARRTAPAPVPGSG